MTVHTIRWNAPFDIACQGGALTVGNFDGVHRGHQALLAELQRQAQESPGPDVVLTFDPHPVKLLRPAHCPPLLTTLPQRTELLRQYGAELVLVLETTWDLLQLSAREFFERVIVQKIQPRTIVPGFNFHFGHNREGNVDTLRQFCAEAGIGFVQIPPTVSGGETISSSRIRAMLQAGRVKEAIELLGRPYSLAGTVVEGQKRGKELGFPTANLEQIETLLPADGVYAARVHFDNQQRPGAANIGPNPTFGEDARKMEVHLVGFSGDLYGKRVRIEFLERLRDTRPFPSLEELVAQLNQDVERTKQIYTD